jgi:hypothetical protein
MADVKKSDPAAEARAARHAELDAQLDREDALAAVPQKVTDGNETAALATITGQKPIRDESEAPPANELGPHHSGEDTPESKAIDAEVKDEPKADLKAHLKAPGKV